MTVIKPSILSKKALDYLRNIGAIKPTVRLVMLGCIVKYKWLMRSYSY